MSAMGGSEEHFCKLLRGDWRQGLEAVGRKDLPRSAKTCADFFPWHTPTVSLPADGVIFCHLADHAHTQDFFQAMFLPQSSMSIAWVARRHGEALFPHRQETQLQEVIGCFEASDPRQAHLLHQPVLQSFN